MNKRTDKFLSLIMSMIVLLSLIPAFTATGSAAATATFNLAAGTWSSGDDTSNKCSWNGTVLTVNNGASIEITGTVSNGRYVRAADNAAANITLNGLSITAPSGGQPPFYLNLGSNVTLTLVGENFINAWLTGWAGIQVSDTAALTFSEASTGELTVTGGNTMSAGIGGYHNGSGGSITINGGTITVTGSAAAGIGGGYGSASGTITINGGNVTATGGVGSACIGGGRNGSGGSNIIINGGTITAIGGGTYSAGIGNGEYGKGGSFTMNGNAVVFTSSINVNATYTKGIHFTGNNGVMYGNVTLNQNVTFDSNKSLFTGNNTLAIMSGYTLTNNGTIATDGGTILHGGGYGTYIGNSPMRAVTLYTIPGIPAPIVGAAPITSVDTAQYSGTIKWSPLHSVFQEWTTYTADITLTAKSDYTFAVVPANAFTISGATQISNNLGSGNITAKFSIGNADNYLFDVSNGTITIALGTNPNTLKVTQDSIVKDNIPKDDQITISGTYRSYQGIGNYVQIASGITAKIKLSHLNLDLRGSSQCSFNMSGATVSLELFGDNIIKSGYNGAALQASAGSALTIYGDGSLVAASGGTSTQAGIGGSGKECGNIIINSGTITASGANDGAGIGGGGNGAGGSITINGGTIIANAGYAGGAGIGSGNGGTDCEVTINGGTVTANGGGSSNDAGIGGAGSTVTITGGTVIANGGKNYAAGIGGGGIGTDVTITITGGTVTATGSSLCAGIGGAQNGSGGNITINGGIVTAIGGKHGIGSGNNGAVGAFTMNGSAVVFASSISDVSPKENGILFIGNIGIVYGDVIIEDDVEIPNGYTLTVQSSTILTIPEGVDLTNNGTAENRGNIIVTGRLMNNGVINNYNTINGTGERLGNSPIHIIELDNDTPPNSGNGWTYINGIYTILDHADVLIVGTNANKRRVMVAADATANTTLKNVSITGLAGSQSPFLLNAGANVTLTLVSNNFLKAGDDCAGIYVPDGAKLTMDGEGTVTAEGGLYGAGIGSQSSASSSSGGTGGDGIIIINSGTVIAKGGYRSAGIGGGGYSDCGTIEINGGTVEATGGYDGAGIGSYSGSCGAITINDGIVTAAGGIGGSSGAGIGGGSGSAGGIIEINGGRVTAIGGAIRNSGGRGAGIGGGGFSSGGTITINDGTVIADAESGAGIGGGSQQGDGGTIEINGGIVTATSKSGAGIGGGEYGNGGNITINGGRVEAISNYGSGIGGGQYGGGGNIIIRGGMVTAISDEGGDGGAGIGNGDYIYNDDVGTFTMDGNCVVFSSSVNTTRIFTRGILFVGNNGAVYGGVALENDLEVPNSYSLTVLDGAALNIPNGITLMNNGAIIPANGSAVTISGTVLGNKIGGANVSALTMKNKTHDSISFYESNLLAATGQDVEYGYSRDAFADPENYQGTPVFTGLTPDTTYYFFVRSKENKNFNPELSDILPVATYAAADITDVMTNEDGTEITVAFVTFVDANVIIAFYDGSKLLSFIPASVTQSGEISDIYIHGSANTIKVIIWDRLNTMQPLCDAVTKVKNANHDWEDMP